MSEEYAGEKYNPPAPAAPAVVPLMLSRAGGGKYLGSRRVEA